ncbi:MAG: FkbM family methyltransferase [Phycisphaerales bacterium]
MHVYERLPDLLKTIDHPVILEIGAHYGQDTVELRRLFPGARLWAFEPDPRNVYRLRKHGIDAAATIVEAAIGDREGTMEMLLSSGTPPKGDPMYRPNQPKEWSYSSSLKRPVKHLEHVPWVKFDQRARVAVTTLDAFAAREGLTAIDFIWADVQGAEDQMIAGGQRALAITSYLYTEYADEEIYEGQIGLGEIVRRLPGRWQVIEDYGDDALLRNVTKLDGLSSGDAKTGGAVR